MSRTNRLLRIALAPIALLGAVLLNSEPVDAAVVYCKTVGVPKGCVMRTTPVAGDCHAWRRCAGRGRSPWNSDEPRRSGESRRSALS